MTIRYKDGNTRLLRRSLANPLFMLSLSSKKATLLLFSCINNNERGTMEGRRQYRYGELEEIREGLEGKIKRKVLLEIQENYYREDFYEENPVNNLLLLSKEDKSIKYNVGLYKKYRKGKVQENIRRIMAYRVGLGCYDRDGIILRPEKYNEEVALKCGLMPFKYVGNNREREVKLVMLCVYPGYVFLMKPRLDAYQVLMSGSISRRNVLESNEGYFKQIVGKETTEEVKKKLRKKHKVYFYFQNE